jgi:hypothetical protein
MPFQGSGPMLTRRWRTNPPRFLRTWLCAVALCFMWPADAHHTSAMFDQQKSVTLTGTVRLFQWTNPHCWIQLVVEGRDSSREWSIEMGPPVDLLRNGWKRGTLKPGDRITVVIRPTRDGSDAGLFVSATRADGTPITGDS